MWKVYKYTETTLHRMAGFLYVLETCWYGGKHLFKTFAHSPEDGSEMLAENSGTIILFSFKTQCVESQLFLLWILSPITYFLVSL